jgi:hypothetical protein
MEVGDCKLSLLCKLRSLFFLFAGVQRDDLTVNHLFSLISVTFLTSFMKNIASLSYLVQHEETSSDYSICFVNKIFPSKKTARHSSILTQTLILIICFPITYYIRLEHTITTLDLSVAPLPNHHVSLIIYSQPKSLNGLSTSGCRGYLMEGSFSRGSLKLRAER